MKLKLRYMHESRMDKSRVRVVLLSLGLSCGTPKRPLVKNGHAISLRG